jgi:Pvc16 N-terminal domain
VIDDVDLSIAALLEHELPPEILTQAAITFATPDDSFPPAAISLPAIDLFLYDMRENRDLRSAEWSVELDEHRTGLTRERPPVRIDCTYLVTAWPSESSMTPALDEHHLLGATLTALLRHPVLPEAVRQGVLARAAGEVPTTMLHQGQVGDMSNFWQALGGRPRAAFGYTVTIAVQAFDLLPAGKPVRDKQIGFDAGSRRRPDPSTKP